MKTAAVPRYKRAIPSLIECRKLQKDISGQLRGGSLVERSVKRHQTKLLVFCPRLLCKQGVRGSSPLTSTNSSYTRMLSPKHYDARCLKGFKTATSKCAKSPSFRVATVRP
jgi:hypothetical protein